MICRTSKVSVSAELNGSQEEYSHFFLVKLDLFDGPIDLLLHLVKLRELPIEKVALAEVAGQYMECLEQMRRFDLEIAGEYLVIAATLVSIKSSLLLNDPVNLVPDESGNMIDPHEELLRRLREAEVYKEGAVQLGERKLLGFDVFAPPSSLRGIEPKPVEYQDHDPMLLGKAFRKLLAEAGEEITYNITVDSVSVVERMMKVIEVLRLHPNGVSFRALVPDIESRASIIGTLISLLELCKRQVIEVQQGLEEDEIDVLLVLESVDVSTFSSEFDVTTTDEGSSDDAKEEGEEEDLEAVANA